MTNKDINIKAELKSAGMSQSEIARMLKVSPVSINDVISEKRKNPRIRKVIALILGRSESEIWPDKQNTPALSSMVAKKG